MRQLTISLTIMVMVVLSAAMILTASSCTQDGAGAGAQAGLSLENSDAVVIARVGTTDITLSDLLAIPQLYQLVDDRLINNEIIRQEATKRGIVIDMEKVQKEIDDMIMMSGGMDQFMSNMNPVMPLALISGDIQSYFLMNATQKAITEDEYDKTMGVPLEETIDNEWNTNMDYWRNVYANENEIEDKTTVTKEMAHSIIVRELKVRWVSENMGMVISGLRDQYTVENIMRNLVDSNQPAGVPLVSGGNETETTVPELTLPVPDASGNPPAEEGEAGSDAGNTSGE